MTLDLTIDSLICNIKSTSSKRKKLKLNFIKMKIFYTSKDSIIKGDGDIFANHKSDKSLISRVHKENLQLNNNKRTNNLTEKWANCLNKYFFKEDIQMANKHMKICSISLIIMKMQKKSHHIVISLHTH